MELKKNIHYIIECQKGGVSSNRPTKGPQLPKALAHKWTSSSVGHAFIPSQSTQSQRRPPQKVHNTINPSSCRCLWTKSMPYTTTSCILDQCTTLGPTALPSARPPVLGRDNIFPDKCWPVCFGHILLSLIRSNKGAGSLTSTTDAQGNKGTE